MRAQREFTQRVIDFPRGLVSGVADLGKRPDYLRVADDVEPGPFGAVQTRKGTQRACSATLEYEPHTLMEWVSAGGSTNKYAACKDSPNGRLYRITGSARTAQTTPFSLAPGTWLNHTRLNGALFATESSGSSGMMLYRATNTAETWLASDLPVPGATLTLTAAAAGGFMATGTYWYRLRWRHTDGSSKSSTPQSVVVTGPTGQVTISTIPLGARTDYVGWTIERASDFAGTPGPWRLVVDGTATSHIDTLAVADLGYEADERLHGTIPDGHLNGVIAYKDRLIGWVGSVLYASQAIADLEATGIQNWDARNEYPVGKDDGEPIQCVIEVGDSLYVFKDWSVWAFEGDDLVSFRVRLIHRGAGAAGPRAATSMGGVAWFHGLAGLHTISASGQVAPFGWVEVGDIYRTGIAQSRLSEVVLRNHLSQRLLMAYSEDGVTNTALLVHDLRFRQWFRWRGIRAQDILVQAKNSFGSTDCFLYADPLDRDSGAGGDFRVMLGYQGSVNDAAADGSGGTEIQQVIRHPDLDGGAPDTLKIARRIEVFAVGAGSTLTATITAIPSRATRTVVLSLPDTGKKWDTGVWGDGVWGSPPEGASVFQGLADGLIGKKFVVEVVAATSSPISYNGFVLDGHLLPDRRLS